MVQDLFEDAHLLRRDVLFDWCMVLDLRSKVARGECRAGLQDVGLGLL